LVTVPLPKLQRLTVVHTEQTILSVAIVSDLLRSFPALTTLVLPCATVEDNSIRRAVGRDLDAKTRAAAATSVTIKDSDERVWNLQQADEESDDD
jgi:hypothetical protein